MAFFTWNDSYSVSVDDFDRQHKRLFEMINGLYDAMKQGKGNDTLSGLLSGLKNYTATHFANEEKELKRINYPDYAVQKTQHDAFVAKIADFQQKFAAGKVNLSAEILNFLKDWLTNHIMVVDKKYAPYFTKVSVK